MVASVAHSTLLNLSFKLAIETNIAIMINMLDYLKLMEGRYSLF